MLYENWKLGLAKGNPYISHWKLSNSMLNSICAYWSYYYWYWKLQHWYFKRKIIKIKNKNHNVICNFRNTEGSLQHGQAVCNMNILLHLCIIFHNFNKWSYFRVREKNVSFIHIRILILQNFSLFPISDFFNVIGYTYIKFHYLYMHKTLYTFILIFKHSFFTVKACIE